MTSKSMIWKFKNISVKGGTCSYGSKLSVSSKTKVTWHGAYKHHGHSVGGEGVGRAEITRVTNGFSQKSFGWPGKVQLIVHYNKKKVDK